MSPELPGFYFDVERNRYFPLPSQRSQPGSRPPPGTGRQQGTAQGISGSRQRQGQAGNGEGGVSPDATATTTSCKHLGREGPFCLSREINGGRAGGNQKWRTRPFPRHFLEMQTLRPLVWEYGELPRKADAALQHVQVRLQGDQGDGYASMLFIGGSSGSLGAWEAATSSQSSDSFSPGDSLGESSVELTHLPAGDMGPIQASSLNLQASGNSRNHSAPGSPPVLWRSPDEVVFNSRITAIKTLAAGRQEAAHGLPPFADRVVVTTLGAERAGGGVFVLESRASLQRGTTWQRPVVPWEVVTTHSMHSWSLWTAEASPCLPAVSLGTSSGAVLLDIENGTKRPLCQGSSACLAMHFHPSGDLLFCGFRNGAISSVDLRLPMPISQYSWPPPGLAPLMPRRGGPRNSAFRRVSARGMRHHFGFNARTAGSLYRTHGRRARLTNGEPGFQGRVHTQGIEVARREAEAQYCSHSPVMQMTSAVCSMALFHSNDNYLIASAMDGSLVQWDRRQVSKPVRTFEGHINSHTNLQLAIDDTDSLLISGGEDCALRIWSIASGCQLSALENLSAPVTTVSWPSTNGLVGLPCRSESWEASWLGLNHPWGVWLGSSDTILYMHGSRCNNR